MFPDIDSLRHSLGFWEKLNYIFTFCVLIGVLGEFLAEFTNFLQVKKKKYRKKRLNKASVIVLLIGLAGELLCLVETIPLSRQMTETLNLQTENARRDAAKANERAALANERADILEQKAKPRMFTTDQISTIAHFLQYSPRGAVDISFPASDVEAKNFANTLRFIFNLAQYPNAPNDAYTSTEPFTGVRIWMKFTPDRNIATAIGEILKSQNQKPNDFQINPNQEPFFIIEVGSKP